MNKIEQAFENKKAFIPFITAGDPDISVTKELILALQEAGADMIEIGIPFSDPVAEGPIIQEADERALAAGTTTDMIFDMLEECQNDIHVPIVFLSYVNPIFVYGIEKFAKRMQSAGAHGVIVPDIPYEEKDEIESVFSQYDLTLVTMIALTSSDRIQMIAKAAKGFVYAISSVSVDAAGDDLKERISSLFSQVKKEKDIPCVIGFEIHTPEQAKDMAEVADGIVIENEIVKLVAKYGKDSIPYVKEYAKSMKEGCR